MSTYSELLQMLLKNDEILSKDLPRVYNIIEPIVTLYSYPNYKVWHDIKNSYKCYLIGHVVSIDLNYILKCY